MSKNKPVVFDLWAIEAEAAQKAMSIDSPMMNATGRIVNISTQTLEWSLNEPITKTSNEDAIKAKKAAYVKDCIKKGMGLKDVVVTIGKMNGSEKRRLFGTDTGLSRSSLAPIYHALNPSPTRNRGPKKRG